MDLDEKLKVKIKTALNTMEFNRYPTNDMSEIKKLYAKYAKTKPENIIVGNGSDEVLELIIGHIINEEHRCISLVKAH